MKNIKLKLRTDKIRVLASRELELAAAGYVSEKESIVYWCPGNTSIQRSCSSCTE